MKNEKLSSKLVRIIEINKEASRGNPKLMNFNVY